jgi:ribose transport system substrate-binding protein
MFHERIKISLISGRSSCAVFLSVFKQWLALTSHAMLVLIALSFSTASLAQDKHYFLVGKSQADINFRLANAGCNFEAKTQGDTCTLIGPEGSAHAREQFLAIQSLKQMGNYDGIAVSVIDSALIRQALDDVADVPLISFDSALSPQYQTANIQHVGVDDEAFGAKLAEIAKQAHPNGGSICFFAEGTPNIQSRLLGARRLLSGDADFPKATRLSGEGGWTESLRCPWDTTDNTDKTMRQLKLTLASIQPDVILSLGHWPVFDAKRYTQQVMPYQENIAAAKPSVVVAIGNMQKSYEALLNQQLVTAMVSIDFFKLGQVIYHHLSEQHGHEAHGEQAPHPEKILRVYQ